MKRDDLITIVKISVAMASVITLIYMVVLGKEGEPSTILRAISAGISITSVFWVIHVKWLWKFPLFNQIIVRPNLNGTWEGELVSDWKGENGRQVAPKAIIVVIRQDFLNFHITTFTNNFIGVSYVESLLIDKPRGVQKVVYLYKKETADYGTQESNEGVSELRLMSNDKQKLEGRYWTNIKTNGYLKLEKVSEKHVESFEEGQQLLQSKI
ncbi:MAG: hypothetical protein IPN76_14145 [Saprospiraceae bacterium]|nr:hypothetical protein [Saprospiraceae bacterium]